MKISRRMAALALALVMCLTLAACGGKKNQDDLNDDGDNNGVVLQAPPVLEGAAYDSAADASGFDAYYGVWKGADDARCDTLEVSATEGGMYFTFYKDGQVTASGGAQVIPEYDSLYFFNEHDGSAYLTQGSASEMTVESLGTYTMDNSAAKPAGAFSDIADVWFQDGELNGASCIVIESNGRWTLSERSATGEELAEVDHGYLEQDTGDAEQYAAHSDQFDDVTYDMHTTYERDTFWWGGENDTYLRQANSQ